MTVQPYPLLADFGGKATANGYALYNPPSWAGEALFKPYRPTVCGFDGDIYGCKAE